MPDAWAKDADTYRSCELIQSPRVAPVVDLERFPKVFSTPTSQGDNGRTFFEGRAGRRLGGIVATLLCSGRPVCLAQASTSSMLQTPRRTGAGKPIRSALWRHSRPSPASPPGAALRHLRPGDELAFSLEANRLASPQDLDGHLHADEREILVDLVPGQHRHWADLVSSCVGG